MSASGRRQSIDKMKKSVNPKLLLAAMLFVAVVASVVGVFELSERQHLLKQGVETTGVVVGIDVGVRGIRSVEARVATFDGHAPDALPSYPTDKTTRFCPVSRRRVVSYQETRRSRA
jgi:hypothetical protein